MSAAAERENWVQVVRDYAQRRDLVYEAVGGINPRDAPAALCVGGSNRLTGQLTDGFWGSSCDALERESGRFLSKTVLPEAVLVKAHMPDLARVVPRFDVESIEARPDELLRRQTSRRKVEFESMEFNKRFLATVPSDHDPIALRELFSPAFLTWTTRIDREVDFGGLDRQLWFMWRLRERTAAELDLALGNAGELFRRVRRELEEENVVTYPAGPWNAGQAPFPGGSGAPQSSG
ncbi:MAG TPA: hypothetical protein VKA36_05230 [Solirubrobacterales bacterium]|nr:hypothetical protein [Solirubrobacterales bacterium]